MAEVPPPESMPELPDIEELYSSWSLFLVWVLHYLQIKRIRAIHETLVSLVAGTFAGFIMRLAPGLLIRQILFSYINRTRRGNSGGCRARCWSTS